MKIKPGKDVAPVQHIRNLYPRSSFPLRQLRPIAQTISNSSSSSTPFYL